MDQKKKKAVVLLSGGLDSVLAAKIVQEQETILKGVTFRSYFFDPSLVVAKQAQELGIPFETIDISREQLRLVKNPRYGYGKNMNPCIDCHSLMLKKAWQAAKKFGADFLVTGEVVRQRPKSQNEKALEIVEKEARVGGLVLRPLSAGLLPETIAEKNGWVDREKLFSIRGRSRKKQLELSKKFNLREYTSPAGGCLLTDPNFSQRLRDLLAKVKSPSFSDLALLKLGRHFWKGNALLVVGRNKEENEKIKNLFSQGDIIVELKDIPGPTTLIRLWRKAEKKEAIKKAKELTKYYSSKARKKKMAEVDFLVSS